MRNSVFILVFILLSCNSVSKPDVKQMVCQYADGSTITDSILLADIALEVRRLGLDTNNVALIKTKIKGILGSQKNLNELKDRLVRLSYRLQRSNRDSLNMQELILKDSLFSYTMFQVDNKTGLVSKYLSNGGLCVNQPFQMASRGNLYAFMHKVKTAESITEPIVIAASEYIPQRSTPISTLFTINMINIISIPLIRICDSSSLEQTMNGFGLKNRLHKEFRHLYSDATCLELTQTINTIEKRGRLQEFSLIDSAFDKEGVAIFIKEIFSKTNFLNSEVESMRDLLNYKYYPHSGMDHVDTLKPVWYSSNFQSNGWSSYTIVSNKDYSTFIKLGFTPSYGEKKTFNNKMLTISIFPEMFSLFYKMEP